MIYPSSNTKRRKACSRLRTSPEIFSSMSSKTSWFSTVGWMHVPLLFTAARSMLLRKSFLQGQKLKVSRMWKSWKWVTKTFPIFPSLRRLRKKIALTMLSVPLRRMTSRNIMEKMTRTLTLNICSRSWTRSALDAPAHASRAPRLLSTAVRSTTPSRNKK